MLVKITDGSVIDEYYTIEKLRAENPNTSFPDVVPSSVLLEYGVHTVEDVDPPTDYNRETHQAAFSIRDVDGVWTQVWETVQRSESKAADMARMKRDKLLRVTDHYALSDNTLSTEMATYRQALRDVPSQSGFPFNVTWPTKP